MKLSKPLIITPRLMVGLKVGNDSFISIVLFGQEDGRQRYKYYIDTPKFEHEGSDIKSGFVGDGLQRGLECLLSFLTACAESRRHAVRTGYSGENSVLFPDNVGEWAEQHSDELELLWLELQENDELITEE